MNSCNIPASKIGLYLTFKGLKQFYDDVGDERMWVCILPLRD